MGGVRSEAPSAQLGGSIVDLVQIKTRLAIAGGMLYVTASSCHSQSDYESTITALDLATGAVSWQARQNSTVDKLVVDAGVLVTHGYCHVCDEDRDQVVAYRAGTGARLPNVCHTEPARRCSSSAP